MKCPKCGNDVSDTLLICPFCNTSFSDGEVNNVIKVQTQVVQPRVIVKTISGNNVMKRKKNDQVFFKVIIVVGIIILIFLLVRLALIKDNKDVVKTSNTTTTQNIVSSNNIGVKSTYAFPMSVGDVTLASIFDDVTNRYTNVDIYGNRFINGDELDVLINAYLSDQVLNDGFIWSGFEYMVKLNDLTYLGERSISPILEASLYQLSGNDFFLVGDHYYKIEVKSIYEGKNIKNGESAIVKVLYQEPIGIESVICFGSRTNSLGCFKRG